MALYAHFVPLGSLLPRNLHGQTVLLLPVRLIIPKIHVDSSVERVGLSADGAMGAPGKPADVAWYERGTYPGEIGSAVIAGHSGWKDGKAAAFDELSELRAGDTLYVEDGRGEYIVFVVREVRTYDPLADAQEVFISHDDKSHLNLVTCEGVWDNALKKYPLRLVVFADKEE